jgi:predicted MPP superfamily phosphohydrolase
MSLLGIWAALRGPSVKMVPIPHPGLHPDLHGLRIAQISDLHVSELLGESYVRKVVDQLMSLKPDLIAITGDLVDGPRHQLKDAVRPLADLKAPMGVHYVTGNHEYFWGAQGWISDFRQFGFEVLENSHRLIGRAAAKLLVVGVNDHSAGRFGEGSGPDALKAVEGAPKADFTLFLAHQPQAYSMAEEVKSDLMLAGHTHGGQFMPFPGLVKLFHRYFKGLYRHEDKFWVYVNPGSGFWGPPNRLGVPAELTLLELRRV